MTERHDDTPAPPLLVLTVTRLPGYPPVSAEKLAEWCERLKALSERAAAEFGQPVQVRVEVPADDRA